MRFKIYTSFLMAFIFGGMLTLSLNAQTANTYLYVPSAGATLDPMTGATTILNTGNDDTPSALQNIGFNFVYEGVTYTQFSITPDGFVKLGAPVAVSQFTNAITSTTNIPKLFPFWDDLATGTTGSGQFVVTGSAPNRILKIQWFVTIPRNTAGAANSTFQAWLYETTNAIEFRYGAVGGATLSASIGINGTTATNFISITTPAGTSSTTVANNANTAWPGNGTMYTFLPPAPCTAPPTGGTTVSSSNPACSGVNFTLSVSGSSVGTGLTYQWESSPNGTVWSPIAGATGQNLTTSQTAVTFYRRQITCSAVSANSSSLQVTMAAPSSCYCSAGATSTSFEKISNVTFNTINNSSSSTAGYEDFTAISTTVTAGATYSATTTISGPFSSDQVIIFIDFNQDGDFTDAGETVYTSPQGVGPHTGSISIPTTATAGNTRMRVRMHDAAAGPNATSCGTSSFGQVEDYTVNIFIPPCVITCPANITVVNDPNQCGAIVNYPAPTTSGICGPVVTTPASGSFFPRGTTTVTATEPGGGICTFTITVSDVQPPVITCPANITVNNTAGLCGAIVNFAPVASDNCPGVTVVNSPASGSVFPRGTTTVTSTATDASGNTATCSFTVTVNDTQVPTITCPANITVGNGAGLCGAVVNYPLPTIADNCAFPGPQSLSQTTSNSIGPVIQIGCQAGGFHTNNSYWRAYNLAAAGLPGALTVNTVTFGIETANASGTGTTQPVTVRLHTSAGAFPGGVLTQVASQLVNVPDQTNSLFTVTLTTPPTVPANAILVVELFTPDGRAPANNVFFIGSNNLGQTAPGYISAADCGVPTPVTLASLGFPNMHIVLNVGGVVAGPNPLTLLSGLASGSTFPVGTTTNTYRVTDAAGNTATCSFNVTVNDTQAPAITCPANITVTTAIGACTAPVTYTVTSADNCPGVTQVLQSGLASGSAFPLGVNNVTWRATDAAGNISTCTFTVTVLDGQLPVITTPPVNTTVCTGGNATFTVVATNVLGYQWQAFNGTTWNNIAGATSANYTVSNVNVSMNTNSYRVVLTGLCTVVTSVHAKLNVNPLPTIQLTASPTPVLLPGQTTTLTATTNPAGGTYVWMLNGSPISGASGPVLAGLGVDDIGVYSVVYTDPNGCVSTSSTIEVTGAPSGNLFVYPNPNLGVFQVRYYNTVNEPATINVYDSRGARVYRRSLVTTTPYTGIEVNLGSSIPAGVYIVELVNGSGKKIGAKRIVVERR